MLRLHLMSRTFLVNLKNAHRLDEKSTYIFHVHFCVKM